MVKMIAEIIPTKKKAVVISHAKTINVFIMVIFVMEWMIAETSVTKRIAKVAFQTVIYKFICQFNFEIPCEGMIITFHNHTIRS